MVREREYDGLPGIPVLLVLLVGNGVLVWALIVSIDARSPTTIGH